MNNSNEYLVSVRLMTYNHALHIRCAMDGIMMQNTDFKIEIVVGDDFSDDGTLDIVREYKSTDRINIRILKREKGDEYWKERQRSGRLYNFRNILENCRGKYIALLDGDDYWINPFKLQKQVDFLERNPKYSICIHNGLIRNLFNGTKKPFRKQRKSTFTTKDIILKPWFAPTASFVFRRKGFFMPNWKNVSGDIMVLFIASLQGQVYYMNDIMSVYNYGTPNSMSKQSYSNKVSLYKRKMRFLWYIDQHTKFKYIVFTLIKRVQLGIGMIRRMFF